MIPPILILVGPTATGKSALALDIAARSSGVIVNADASQIYADVPILSAQPSAKDRLFCPHLLYGDCPADYLHSAGGWLRRVVPAIGEIRSKGCVPILVGGTGLYLKALLYGLSPIPEVPSAVRRFVRGIHEMEGSQALFLLLQKHDPVMGARLHPHDTQRLMRAYEVWLHTGRSLASWQQEPPVPPIPLEEYRVYSIGLPRSVLYARCDARVDTMLDHGALEEVRALRERYPLFSDLPVAHILGVRPLSRVLEGALSLLEARALVQQQTRHYAKRQVTWFRHQLPCATYLGEQPETWLKQIAY